MCAITNHFVGYLLHASTFRAALAACAAIVGHDKAMKRTIKSRLRALIDDPFYSTIYRPAIMRVSVGDARLVRAHGLHPDIYAVCARNKRMVRSSVRRCAHRVDLIGPLHADIIGEMVGDRVRAHAGKFAQRKARFLTLGEIGLRQEDIRHDLEIFGLRCFRWYYPFRSGVHMDNTVRTTITNRGLSYVKHHTRQCRARMVTDEHGVTTNMESHDELALERYGSTQCMQASMALRLDIERLSHHDSTSVARVAAFIGNPLLHDAFVDWIEARHANAVGAEDICDAVRRSPESYGNLLGEYLALPKSHGRRALRIVRHLVA